MVVGESRAGGTVLVVGTRNVCRSAYVERRLAHLLARAGVTVASAGTEAVAGASMDGFVARRLGRARGSAEDFAARPLWRPRASPCGSLQPILTVRSTGHFRWGG